MVAFVIRHFGSLNPAAPSPAIVLPPRVNFARMEPLYFLFVGGRAIVFASNYKTPDAAVLAAKAAKRLFKRVELRDESPFDVGLPGTESVDEPEAPKRE